MKNIIGKNIIGKKIMAREKLYNIIDENDNECKGWTRSRNIGVIEDITDDIVKVYHSNNPAGYQHYELKRVDFNKWVNEKLYVLK